MMKAVGVTLVASCLLCLPAAAEAGVYAYAEMGISGDSNYIYASATGIAVSDDPDPGVSVLATLYNPSNVQLASNGGYSDGWTVVVYGDAVALDENAPTGTYNAKGVGWTAVSWYGCSPYAPADLSAYRHHYDFTAMGNPNTYSLATDSAGRMCSHSTLSWGETSLSGLTDSGMVMHWGPIPGWCLSVCARGKNNNVIGPAGNTLGGASCD